MGKISKHSVRGERREQPLIGGWNEDEAAHIKTGIQARVHKQKLNFDWLRKECRAMRESW